MTKEAPIFDDSKAFNLGKLLVDYNNRTVNTGVRIIPLTTGELYVLCALNPGRIQNAAQISDRVGELQTIVKDENGSTVIVSPDPETAMSQETVKMHIFHLRSKLEPEIGNGRNSTFIRTVHGVGYSVFEHETDRV